jgi:hypothetical protein
MFLLKHRCSLDEDTLLASKMTAKEIFLSTFQKKSEKPPMQIRNLRYSPQDYLIIVNICDKEDDGRSLFSRAIPGQEISDFFERGCFSLKDVNIYFPDYELPCHDIIVLIHRIADNRVITFFKADEMDHNFGVCSLCSMYNELEMADFEYSQYLFEELMGGEGYDEELMGGEGYDFHTTLALRFTDYDCGCCYGKLASITLETRIFEEGSCERFPGNQAVTFAHFLENMDGWDK